MTSFFLKIVDGILATKLAAARRAIISEAAKFVVRLLIETSVIASSLLLASLHFHSKVNTNIIVTNLCRWIAVSLFIKMGMLYSRITSSVPSLDRNESK